MIRVALLLVAGCGRIGFDASSAGSSDATTDATIDGAAGIAGLVAWYRMETIAGTVVPDASGHGHAATCTACPTTTTGHGAAGALAFDGATTYLQIPHAAELDFAAGFTIALWAKVDQIPTSGYDSFATREIATGNENTFALDLATNGLVEYFSESGSVYGTTTSPAGMWFHVATTYDGATKRVYVNGSNEGSGPGGTVTFDNNPMLLGTDNTGASLDDFLLGAMADVRFYDRVLSDGELAILAAL